MIALEAIKHIKQKENLQKTLTQGICYSFSRFLELNYSDLTDDQRTGITANIFNVMNNWPHTCLESECYPIPFDIEQFDKELSKLVKEGQISLNDVESLVCNHMVTVESGKLDIQNQDDLTASEIGFEIFLDSYLNLARFGNAFTYTKLRLDLLDHIERELTRLSSTTP
jgi:hypothetical protein